MLFEIAVHIKLDNTTKTACFKHILSFSQLRILLKK